MSLFVSTLALEHVSDEIGAAARLGMLLGSLLSAVAGYLLLRRTLS